MSRSALAFFLAVLTLLSAVATASAAGSLETSGMVYEPFHLRPGSPLKLVETNGDYILRGLSLESDPITLRDLLSQFVIPEDYSVFASANSSQAVRTPHVAGADLDQNAATGHSFIFRRGVPGGGVLQETVSVVVMGDVAGTGAMSLSQLVSLSKAFSGARPLTGLKLLAADWNGSGDVDLPDLIREAKLLTKAASPVRPQEPGEGAQNQPAEPDESASGLYAAMAGRTLACFDAVKPEWGSNFTIESDGSFYANHIDIMDENVLPGPLAIWDMEGRLSAPRTVEPFVFETTVADRRQIGAPGSHPDWAPETEADSASGYGPYTFVATDRFSPGDRLLIYAPGCPRDKLPEDARYPYENAAEQGRLDEFFVLYDPGRNYVFFPADFIGW